MEPVTKEETATRRWSEGGMILGPDCLLDSKYRCLGHVPNTLDLTGLRGGPMLLKSSPGDATMHHTHRYHGPWRNWGFSLSTRGIPWKVLNDIMPHTLKDHAGCSRRMDCRGDTRWRKDTSEERGRYNENGERYEDGGPIWNR